MQEGRKGLFVNILILSTLCLFLSFLMAFYFYFYYLISRAWPGIETEIKGGLCDFNGERRKKKTGGALFFFFFFHDFDFYHGGGAIIAFFLLSLPLLLGAFYHNVTSLLI